MTGTPVKCTRADDFCYICGEYEAAEAKRRISAEHEKAYLAYFGFSVSNQTNDWVPHTICKSCHLGLLKWMNDCGGGLNFSRPMQWREPKEHSVDCYFCLTRIDSTGKVEYANVISVTKPVANEAPVCPQQRPTPPIPIQSDEPHLILPNELDLLISGLNLSERNAEMLVKTFQELKILAPFPSFHRRKMAKVT